MLKMRDLRMSVKKDIKISLYPSHNKGRVGCTKRWSWAPSALFQKTSYGVNLTRDIKGRGVANAFDF